MDTMESNLELHDIKCYALFQHRRSPITLQPYSLDIKELKSISVQNDKNIIKNFYPISFPSTVFKENSTPLSSKTIKNVVGYN